MFFEAILIKEVLGVLRNVLFFSNKSPHSIKNRVSPRFLRSSLFDLGIEDLDNPITQSELFFGPCQSSLHKPALEVIF